jgi:hypothetical protein
MKASSLSFQAAVLIVLVGMLWGLEPIQELIESDESDVIPLRGA